MTWKNSSCIRRSLSLCNTFPSQRSIPRYITREFDIIHKAIAVRWIDSWARLQFRFFLNLFSCLLITNLSRRNDRSRVGPQTLFNFRRNGNRQWITITFHVYSRYLATNRDVHWTATGCKWLVFRFTPMMQRNQSAHTGQHKIPSTKITSVERDWDGLFNSS